MIFSTRYLRRGLRACERAGIEPRGVGIRQADLQALLDGHLPWATERAARALLDALPEAVQRGVRSPTLASGVLTTAGRVPVALIAPILDQEIEQGGIESAAARLGLWGEQLTEIRRREGWVSFAVADRVLTRAGSALDWHLDPSLRRAYFGYADNTKVLRPA